MCKCVCGIRQKRIFHYHRLCTVPDAKDTVHTHMTNIIVTAKEFLYVFYKVS